MSNFGFELRNKIKKSKRNNFGVENYDEFRYGKFVKPKSFIQDPVVFLKELTKRAIGYECIKFNTWINGHEQNVEELYENLNSQGKHLLVELIAYHFLGYKHVKLERNNKAYWDAVGTGNSMADKNDTYDPHFLNIILEKVDLNPIGFDVKMFFSGYAIAIDFILEQYAYKFNNRTIVEVEAGDVVIDGGACWGDTALYFAHKTGEHGKVYSFEFIPDNIKLFNINRSFNPHLEKLIELVPLPLYHTSGVNIYFKDNGPGSRIGFQPFDSQTGSTTTITIDDLVNSKNISKVDFIKMDIEGAETSALNGAIETIRKFKPKLAIAIYHSIEDIYNIPKWILGLNMGYEIFIDHFTIHTEETVCFARIKD